MSRIFLWQQGYAARFHCKQVIISICKFPSTFDKISSNDGGDTNKYEWQCSLKGWPLSRPVPCFSGKRFIPQRMVSAEWNPTVYTGLLDPKAPVRSLWDRRCFCSGVCKAPFGTWTPFQYSRYRKTSCDDLSPGKYPDWSCCGLSSQTVDVTIYALY